MNLSSIGESVAKLASEGGMLIVDKLSLFGFFAFCLLFVGFCLIGPVHIYEKYYKAVDDEDENAVDVQAGNQHPAA